MDTLILQGIIFSGIDISIVVILIWWIFLSRIKTNPLPGSGISQRLANVLGLLLVISGIQFFIL